MLVFTIIKYLGCTSILIFTFLSNSLVIFEKMSLVLRLKTMTLKLVCALKAPVKTQIGGPTPRVSGSVGGDGA